jgi:hypothetical protein
LTIVRTRLSAPFIRQLPQPAMFQQSIRSIIVRSSRQSNSRRRRPAPRGDALVWLILSGKLARLPVW